MNNETHFDLVFRLARLAAGGIRPETSLAILAALAWGNCDIAADEDAADEGRSSDYGCEGDCEPGAKYACAEHGGWG